MTLKQTPNFAMLDVTVRWEDTQTQGGLDAAAERGVDPGGFVAGPGKV